MGTAGARGTTSGLVSRGCWPGWDRQGRMEPSRGLEERQLHQWNLRLQVSSCASVRAPVILSNCSVFSSFCFHPELRFLSALPGAPMSTVLSISHKVPGARSIALCNCLRQAKKRKENVTHEAVLARRVEPVRPTPPTNALRSGGSRTCTSWPPSWSIACISFGRRLFGSHHRATRAS